MTREEAIKMLKSKMDGNTDTSYEWAETVRMAIKALKQESIDYKTQYENYLKKSEVVISQLRADRDRLQDAFDKIRAEIIEKDKNIKAVRSDNCCFFTAEEVLEIIDKYKAESEG